MQEESEPSEVISEGYSMKNMSSENTPLLQNSQEVAPSDLQMPVSKLKAGSYQKESSNITDEQPQFFSLDFDRIINSYSMTATRHQNRRRKVGRPGEHNDFRASTVSQQDSSVRSSLHDSNIHIDDHSHHTVRYSGSAVARWIMTCLVGICTGITAVIIVQGVEWLVSFRASRLNRQMQWASGHASEEEILHWHKDVFFIDLMLRKLGWAGVYAGYAGYNVVLVLLSTALCVLFAPMAAGSGIPEVKAYLNGVRVGTFADTKLFIIKTLGTILGVSSGLVVGPEGPVVHLGAIIGASLTKTADMEWSLRHFRRRNPRVSGFLGCADYHELDFAEGTKTPMHHNDHKKRKRWWSNNNAISTLMYHLAQVRNDLERRNLISIGAAAGFASAFGAPVGGLLYSMEEASSFFAHDMLWKTLTATALATLCIAIYYGNLKRYSMLSLEIGETEESLLTQFNEAPLYITMGALGGIFGALFNNTYAFLTKARRDFYETVKEKRGTLVAFKLLESAFISILTSIIMLTFTWKAGICRGAKENDEEFDPSFLQRYNCEPGQINELGSLLFGSREESIKDILTNPEDFDPMTLLTVGLMFLLLMMVTFGVALPTGMFMPSVLTGSSLGGFAGLIIKQYFLPGVHPSDFSLIGAAAFLAGMQRNTVSLCVILMEGTGQTKVLIPVIITVVCARTVGDFFSEGVYEIGMEIKGYPYLEHEARPRYDMFTAADVMSTSFDTVKLVETAGSIEALLLASPHHAFPVVDEETSQYKGIVRRDQLVAALECGIYIVSMSGYIQEPEKIERDYEAQDSDADGIEKGWDFIEKNEAFRMNPGARDSRRKRNTEWKDLYKPEDASTWLRDNVLISGDGEEIMFGMDETLPNGIIPNEAKALVRLMDDKLVVHISPSNRKKQVDVGSMMNRSAFSVMEDCPLSRAYDLFASMGLRHLPVLKDGKVVGVINRSCLDNEHVQEKTGYHLY